MSSESTEKRISAGFKSTTKRDVFDTKKNTPGPGHYYEDAVHSESPKASSSAIFMSNVERSPWGNKSDVDKPGPGEYGYETSFKRFQVAPKLQNFGSTTVRPFDVPKDLQNQHQKTTPGPGYYHKPNDPNSTIQGHITYTNSLSHAPFSTNAPRFTMTESQVPPVGHYDSKNENASFVVDTYKKGKQYGNYGVFGSTSKRFNREKNTLPGPGSYDVHNTPKRDYKSHMFASQTGRLSAPASPTPAPKNGTLQNVPTQYSPGVPPVGSYDVKSDWVKKRPVTHSSVPFISRSERFTDTMDLTVPPTQGKDIVPGPGQYNDLTSYLAVSTNKSFAKSEQGKQMFGSTVRFAGQKQVTHAVGPGSYAVDSAVLNPLVKRSYNVTI
jgi:hypothetical protein